MPPFFLFLTICTMQNFVCVMEVEVGEVAVRGGEMAKGWTTFQAAFQRPCSPLPASEPEIWRRKKFKKQESALFPRLSLALYYFFPWLLAFVALVSLNFHLCLNWTSGGCLVQPSINIFFFHSFFSAFFYHAAAANAHFSHWSLSGLHERDASKRFLCPLLVESRARDSRSCFLQ